MVVLDLFSCLGGAYPQIIPSLYYQQLKKLNQPGNIQDKNDIIKSENKLQQMGFVDYIRNLPSDVQVMLQENLIKYFIPWHAVWKGNSISTPCRVVFDTSQATSSGYSLNDILAKGRNNLYKLQEILIHWSMHRVAVHTDISKMYNTVQLNQSDWCYQRYIWDPDLHPSIIPEEKVIRTLIYGVRSSRNQAEYGLRKVAELSQKAYPKVNHIVQNDIYVDDCITGEDGIDLAHHRADELEIVLNRGGFNLKGVSFSGEDPPTTLTEDGQMIFVGGMKWFVKEDMISINIGELNFAKKHRGRKPSSTVNVIPSKLTRRHCASKVAEIFDLTGKVSPITASMKMDLQELVHHKFDWDDTIPDDLHPIWESNFKIMKVPYVSSVQSSQKMQWTSISIPWILVMQVSQWFVCVSMQDSKDVVEPTAVNLYFLVQEWYHRVCLNQEQSCMLL